MDPKSRKTPAELMTGWHMASLVEYHEVMTEKLAYTQHEIEQTSDKDYEWPLYASELKWLELEVKRIKNCLVVVESEISSRK
jgi:hypothetical protein